MIDPDRSPVFPDQPMHPLFPRLVIPIALAAGYTLAVPVTVEATHRAPAAERGGRNAPLPASAGRAAPVNAPVRIARGVQGTEEGGVGVMLERRLLGLTVASVRKGSPADRAGVPVGARILAINGRTAAGLTTEQAAGIIRGAPGSVVTLKLLVPGAELPRSVEVRRERIGRAAR